jgi:hypothetical protein
MLIEEALMGSSTCCEEAGYGARLLSEKRGSTTEARKHGEDLLPPHSIPSPEKTLREFCTGLRPYRILYQAPVVDDALCQIRVTLGWGEHRVREPVSRYVFSVAPWLRGEIPLFNQQGLFGRPRRMKAFHQALGGRHE